MSDAISTPVDSPARQNDGPADNQWTRVAQQIHSGADQGGVAGGLPGQIVGLASKMESQPITEADVQGKSPDEIVIARNVPFAMHGYEFKNPELKAVFGVGKDDYPANPTFKESDLTPIERRNVDYLHVYELDHNINGARDNFAKNKVEAMPDTRGQLLPNDQTQPLTSADLADFNDSGLNVARNEIFARQGYAFKSPDLQQHFGAMPWYKPDASANASGKFSWVEERNVEFIQMTELDRKLSQ